jgi:site-specific recombinase XerD
MAAIRSGELQRFEKFQKQLREMGRRPKTLQAYGEDWKVFSAWYADANGEAFDLRGLATIDVQDYKTFLLTRGSSVATINRRIAFLKRYVRFGVEEGMVRREIGQAIGRVAGLRRQTLAPRSVRVQDVRRFLKELELCGHLRDQAIVYLFLYTGIRSGELVQVHREDVELSERKGVILVRSEIAKGGRERTVPVPLEARRRVMAYLETRRDSHPELFIGQRGPIHEDAVARVLQKYAQRIGVKITPHLLRHTFAYQYLAKNNNDLVGLAALLGHENLNTTRLYTQKRIEDLEAGVEKVGYP